MPHPLENKLFRLRRHLRMISVTEGLLRLIASLVGAVLLLALCDYTLDFNDTGIRLLLSLLAAGAIITSTWRFLIRPLTCRQRTIDLARVIEAEYPWLGSRLSSAIDFLTHDASDVLAGSAALRGSVIDRTTSEVATLDLHNLLDVRSVATAALLALPICLTAAGLILVDPPAARIALARLVQPLGNDRWSTEILPPPPVPAAIERLDISLLPPSGTDLPPRNSDPHIHAVRGTRATFSGKFTRPVHRAILHHAAGPMIVAQISDDGLRFETAADDFVISTPVNYWLEVDDASGTHRIARSEWRVSVVFDPAPTIDFERPASDVHLTPQAKLPIAIRAADNLRVPHLSLVYTRSDRSEAGEQVVTGVVDLKASDGETATPAGSTPMTEVVRRVGTLWDLASLTLPPGTRIDLRARARDRLNQRGEAVRRVLIVSESTWRTGANARLQNLVARLYQVIAVQRTVRRHVSELATRMRGSTTETGPPIHRLRSIPIEQHQVRQMLSKAPRGILGQIGQEIRVWAASGLERADRVGGLQRAAGSLEALEHSLLDPIRRALSAAVKTAATVDSWPPRKPLATEIADALRKASDDQASLIEALAKIADQLDRQASSETLGDDLRKIRDAQRRILQATRRRLIDSIDGAAELPADRSGDGLARLAEQQIVLATEAGRLAGQRPDPSDALDQLGAQMRQAAQAIEQEHLGRAVQQQEKITEQLNGLTEQEEKSEENESPVASSKSLQEKLTRLVTAQRNLEKATSAFDATRRPSQPPTRTDLRKIARLAEQQAEVHGETERMASTPAAAAAAGEPLTHAATAMQQSATRLGKRETGEETQQWIVKARQHLERARTQLANQPPARRAKQGPAPGKRSDRQRSQRSPSSGGAQAARDGRPAGRAGGGQATPPGPGTSPRGEGNAAPWVKEVWGHLPERMRQQLMQSASDQFLPKYQIPLESYFRHLSEAPFREWDNQP